MPVPLFYMRPLFCFALAILLVLPAAGQETVNLRPQWQAGQSATYSFWTESAKAETVQLAGQTQSGTTTYLNEGEITWTVREVADDGSAVCVMQMTRLKVTITPPEGEAVVVDSENPGGEIPVFDTLLAAMVGEPLTVYVMPDGSIDRVEGVDAMRRAAGEDAADSVPEELDFIESASEMATLIAAPAEAGVGSTWDAQNTWTLEDILPGVLNIEATADYDTTFTLEQLGQVEGVPVASVRSRSIMDIKTDLSSLPEGVADVEVQIGETSARSEILFDLSRHETIARHDVQSYEVTVTVPIQPQRNLTATIVQTTRSQLLRLTETGAE